MGKVTARVVWSVEREAVEQFPRPRYRILAVTILNGERSHTTRESNHKWAAIRKAKKLRGPFTSVAVVDLRAGGASD